MAELYIQLHNKLTWLMIIFKNASMLCTQNPRNHCVEKNLTWYQLTTSPLCPGPCLTKQSDAIANLSANDIAALKESCAPLPLAKMLATASCRSIKTGPQCYKWVTWSSPVSYGLGIPIFVNNIVHAKPMGICHVDTMSWLPWEFTHLSTTDCGIYLYRVP